MGNNSAYMNQNIHINNVRSLDCKLYTGHYYDFMLHKGEVIKLSPMALDELLIADFSTFDIASGTFYSTKVWSGATSDGVELEDIGLTGVDNGFIHFRKDMISNEEFLKLYFESKFEIPSGDTRLFMNPITGNTQMFNYPMYLVDGEEKYIAYKGGFYQGFFKLDGFNYQVLPERFNHDILFHFELRPRTDYGVDIDSVNHLHPENEGIFFYVGTRAENKFWPFYKTSSAVTETMKKDNARTEGYFDGCGESGETYDLQNHIVDVDEWLLDEPEDEKEEGYFAVGDTYFSYNPSDTGKLCKGGTMVMTKADTYVKTYDYQPDLFCTCGPVPPSPSGNCSDYYADDYYQKETCGKGKKAFDEEYVGSDVKISSNPKDYTDSEGHSLSDHGFYEIESDNKFLLFDRTPSGFTVDTWEEGAKARLIGRKNLPNVNYFLLMNRTETGYTVDTIDQYNEENGIDYNLYKDIRGNAFALKVTKDGAIGYRYGVLDCDDPDNESKYKVIEEYSKPGLVKIDDWNSINVRFAIVPPSYNDKCDKRARKMRIMFYVNGFLIFISKEIPALTFKALDEASQKQEGVPYSISLGGGALGLLETILPDYYKISDYVLPIEKDFCGTFLGDIKSFKIYYGDIDYFAIRNYLS